VAAPGWKIRGHQVVCRDRCSARSDSAGERPSGTSSRMGWLTWAVRGTSCPTASPGHEELAALRRLTGFWRSQLLDGCERVSSHETPESEVPAAAVQLPGQMFGRRRGQWVCLEGYCAAHSGAGSASPAAPGRTSGVENRPSDIFRGHRLGRHPPAGRVVSRRSSTSKSRGARAAAGARR